MALTLTALIGLSVESDSLAGPDAGVDMGPLDCVIEPKSMIELGSPAEGILETITVDRSDIVKEGQVLARLESRVEYAEVALARARAEMDGDVQARRASLKFERRLEARAGALYAKNAISLHEKDQSETDAAVAALQLQQAREAKRLAQVELWRATEALQRRTIQSPINGVVVERFVSPGELIDEKPLLKLAELDPLRVEVIAPATLWGSVHPGMSARVTPEPPAAGAHMATVSVVDRIIDAASGTFRVRAELPNPDYALPAGLRCKVRFLSEPLAAPAP